MKKSLLLLSVSILLGLVSCSKDEDNDAETARDRNEQQTTDDALITQFLKTHTYNYTDFETDLANSHTNIQFTKINSEESLAGNEPDSIPLFDLVETHTLEYLDTDYNYYVLKVKTSDASESTFQKQVFATDNVLTTSRAFVIHTNEKTADQDASYYLKSETYDFLTEETPTISGTSTTNSTIGVRHARSGFKVASASDTSKPCEIIGSDALGNSIYNSDFEAGAAFIPSGLMFFSSYINTSSFTALEEQTSTEQQEEEEEEEEAEEEVETSSNYQNFVYTFSTINTIHGDTDGDGILDIYEDLPSDLAFLENYEPTTISYLGDGNLENDDTDGDGVPNYLDTDDDGDTYLTSEEITVADTDTSIDSDCDGFFSNDTDVSYADIDTNNIPDYLEKEQIPNED